MRAITMALPFVVVLACGDDRPAPDHDASTGDAELVPATPGEPTFTALVGQGTTASVELRNAGTEPTGPIALAIMGPAANDFTLDNQLTTCAGAALEPGATCAIAIVFRPLAEGPRTATLTFAASPGGSGVIALSGMGVMPDLHFVPTSVEFGVLDTGTSATRTVELRNDGSADAPIDSITVSGTGFERGSSTCGAMLAAGASCDVVVEATASMLGLLPGTLEISSNGIAYQAPLAATGARRITVTRVGTGTGTVTSIPSGIDCGAMCSARFTTDVTLTASPGAASELVSWSILQCGTAPTCVVTADTAPVTVTVTFALSGPSSIVLTFAGNGIGEARIRDTSNGGDSYCFGSCSVPVVPGASIEILPATFSTFGGFGGACAGQTNLCTFTAGFGASNVTVTFNKDPKEGWTRILEGSFLTAAAYDGSGNLIVASGNSKLTKLSPTGTTMWSIPFDVQSLDTGPSDTIYVRGGGGAILIGLHKLDATGAIAWSRVLPGELGSTPVTPYGGFPRFVAVGVDGAVAVQGSSGFARWTSDGTLSWARAWSQGPPWMTQGIGIEPGGHVVIAAVDFDDAQVYLDKVYGHRFAADDGSPLLGLGQIARGDTGAIDLDANGRLVACYGRYKNGLESYAECNPGPGASSGIDQPWHGGVSSITGDILAAFNTGYGPSAWVVQRVATMGPMSTLIWSLQRTRLGSSSDSTGTWIYNLAVSNMGQVAILGSYTGVAISPTVSWVQVFDP